MLFRTFLEHIVKRFKKKAETHTEVPSYPLSVYLEITNHCNLKCVMCSFHSDASPFRKQGKLPRQKGFMDVECACKIIDELGKSGCNIWLALHGAGEPLLHPHLIDFVKRASEYPNLKTGFLTNGMLLSSKKSKALLDAGIKWISFSLDGLDSALFEKYRKGADYSRIVRNVHDFIEKAEVSKIKPEMHVNMTVQPEMEENVADFVDYWLTYVDRVSVSPCRPMGSRKSELVPPGTKRIPCYMLFEMMVIYWDGSVGLCCEDWFNAGNMGSVFANSVREVWHGRKYRVIRKLHESGRFDEIELCKDCDIWFNRTPQVTVDQSKNMTVTRNAWQVVYERLSADGEEGKNCAL